MKVKEVKKKKKKVKRQMWVLISASCRVTVGNSIISAQHPPFQSRTALLLARVILGCLLLTIAMWPKLSAEIKELDTQLNYSWSEPFLEMHHLDAGWERAFFLLDLKLYACEPLPCPLCGESTCKEQGQERGKMCPPGNGVKASVRSRCAALRLAMHSVLCQLQ